MRWDELRLDRDDIKRDEMRWAKIERDDIKGDGKTSVHRQLSSQEPLHGLGMWPSLSPDPTRVKKHSTIHIHWQSKVLYNWADGFWTEKNRIKKSIRTVIKKYCNKEECPINELKSNKMSDMPITLPAPTDDMDYNTRWIRERQTGRQSHYSCVGMSERPVSPPPKKRQRNNISAQGLRAVFYRSF